MPKPLPTSPNYQLYGHHRARRLRAAQRQAIDKWLPQIEIKPEILSDPAQLFGFTPDDIWLEIGFGAGEHLLSMMRAQPQIGFIGCEPYLHGVARFLTQLDPQIDKNIRLYVGDARNLLPKFAPEAIGRIYLLYPDPWPKTRHAPRRFIQSEILDICAAIMRGGAQLHFASDDPVMTAWVLAHILAHRDFVWHGPSAPPISSALTRYEAKAIAQGRPPARLVFCRSI